VRRDRSVSVSPRVHTDRHTATWGGIAGLAAGSGFQRVSLGPGQSAQVSFTVTPQEMSWWDDSANGWTQTEGTYGVYVGDCSDISGLPLQGTFTMAATSAAPRS
jgi:hypothetical protein